MKKIKFKDKYYESIFHEIKTATTRISDKELKEGEEFELVFPNNPSLIGIVDKIIYWGNGGCIIPEIAKMEGYLSHFLFLEELKEIYGYKISPEYVTIVFHLKDLYPMPSDEHEDFLMECLSECLKEDCDIPFPQMMRIKSKTFSKEYKDEIMRLADSLEDPIEQEKRANIPRPEDI